MSEDEWGYRESIQSARLKAMEGALPLTAENDDEFGPWCKQHGPGSQLKLWVPPPRTRLDSVHHVFSTFINVARPAGLRSFEASETPRDHGRSGDMTTHPDRDPGIEFAPATDVLAFYRSARLMPFWDLLRGSDAWGIYLRTAGIESLARAAFRPMGLDDEAALRAAAFSLYSHELYHHLCDSAAANLEEHRSAATYSNWRASHGTPYNHMEEGAANAFAIRALTDDTERDALKRWTSCAPHGYRDAHRMLSDEDFRTACHGLLSQMLDKTRAQLTTSERLAFDVGLRETGPGSVPIHLIESPGSAYEAGLWEWRFP